MEDITDYLIDREDSIEYKTSDKNVGSIEEDIKILESMLEEYYSCSVPGMNMHIDIYFSLEQAEAIEHILAEREQNKKRIKELEEENYIQKIELTENSIPVQKVKDKIEENKEYRKYANTAFEYTQQEVHDEIVKAFEELLEENNK